MKRIDQKINKKTYRIYLYMGAFCLSMFISVNITEKILVDIVFLVNIFLTYFVSQLFKNVYKGLDSPQNQEVYDTSNKKLNLFNNYLKYYYYVFYTTFLCFSIYYFYDVSRSTDPNVHGYSVLFFPLFIGIVSLGVSHLVWYVFLLKNIKKRKLKE